MKVDDVELYETYIVGSQQALRDGQYSKLRRAIPLAYGRYVNARGQCGRIVRPAASQVGTQVFVVAIEERRRWRNPDDNRHREWEVDTVTPRQLLITAAELAERQRIEAEDAERHRRMRAEVGARRAELAGKFLQALGLPTHGVDLRMAYVSKSRRGERDGDYAPEVTIEYAALQAMLADADPAVAELLAAWQAIEDPAC